MKYEKIKIGDVFIALGCEERVISKSDEHRVITTIDSNNEPTAFREKELHCLKPRKEDLLDKTTELVNEFGNHIIEQTKSGVIILTPLS